MSWHHIKGVIGITGITGAALMAWMGWVSLSTISNQQDTAVAKVQTANALSSITELKTESDKQTALINWIVTKYGANPQAILDHVQVNP